MISQVHSGKLRNMASIYLRRNNQLLLLYRQGNSIVSNLWIGSAGGHFEKGEVNDAKACVMRELMEELALAENTINHLSLRYITLRYTDNEIRQNYYFFADLTDDTINIPHSNEGITQWYPLEELTQLLMPVTARHIIDHYIRIGQYDTSLYVGISNHAKTDFYKLQKDGTA